MNPDILHYVTSPECLLSATEKLLHDFCIHNFAAIIPSPVSLMLVRNRRKSLPCSSH